MNVQSCTSSAQKDEEEGTVPYSDDVCQDEIIIEQDVSKFNVQTMMVSQTFNPYRFKETGKIQTTTRYDGDYWINDKGNYNYWVTLKNDTFSAATYYANMKAVTYSDGFLFGLNQIEMDTTEYQLGQVADFSRTSEQPYYAATVYQGIKQTETVYQIEAFSSFVANFAALVMSAFAGLGFMLGGIQEFYVEA